MRRTRTVVAIPVNNESERIGACLRALARQTLPADDIVLLLNNCTDATAAIIAGTLSHPSRLHVIECSLPPLYAGAGEARRIAMDHAAAIAGIGVLLTIDADGEAGPDWVAGNLAAIALGADAVCGQAYVDHIEALNIPAHLHDDNEIEIAYHRLLDKIAARLDPNPADPWPRHTEECGASIAVTTEIYAKVGGMPRVLSGEDRLFIHALRLIDARIRHAPGLQVAVSGRVEGRAKGGMADTIKRRIVKQDEFTDDQIEPACLALRRMRARRRARYVWQGDVGLDRLARALAVPWQVAAEALRAPYFGTAWHRLEQASPRMVRQRVAFTDIPRQTVLARRFYERVWGGARRLEAAPMVAEAAP